MSSKNARSSDQSVQLDKTVSVEIRRYRPADRERIKALTIEGFTGLGLEWLIEERWPGTSGPR